MYTGNPPRTVRERYARRENCQCVHGLCCGSLVIRLYYNTIIIDDIHVHYLCFSLCLVEGTHREHVQLVEIDAPDVAHVDGTLNMLNMSRIHKSKSVRGRWLLLKGCVSPDKSAMAS